MIDCHCWLSPLFLPPGIVKHGQKAGRDVEAKSLMKQALDGVQAALALDNNCSRAHLWSVCLFTRTVLGTSSSVVVVVISPQTWCLCFECRAAILVAKVANSTKEKIENAFKIKEHAVRACVYVRVCVRARVHALAHASFNLIVSTLEWLSDPLTVASLPWLV